jgi:hypothetical protein
MCGLPVFPPKPKLDNLERPRCIFRRIAMWVKGAQKSNRIPQEAHADRPASSRYTPAERTGVFLKAGREPQ